MSEKSGLWFLISITMNSTWMVVTGLVDRCKGISAECSPVNTRSWRWASVRYIVHTVQCKSQVDGRACLDGGRCKELSTEWWTWVEAR